MTTQRDVWPPPAPRATPPPFEPRYAFARDVTTVGRPPRETPTSQTTMTGTGAGTGLFPFPFANAPPMTTTTTATATKRGRPSDDDFGLVLPGAFGDSRLGADDAFVERFRFNEDIIGTNALGHHHSLDSSKQMTRSQADNSAPMTMTLPGGTSEGCEFARCSGGGPSAGDSAMRDAAFHEEARASLNAMRSRQNDLSDEMAGVKRMLMDIMTTQSNLLAALTSSSRRPFDDAYVDDRDGFARMCRRATPNETCGRDYGNDVAHRVSALQPRTTTTTITTPSDDIPPRALPIADDVDDDDEEETEAAGAELTESELRKRVLSRMLAHQRRRRNDDDTR